MNDRRDDRGHGQSHPCQQHPAQATILLLADVRTK